MAKAPLIILSGPSGSGKTTVTSRLLADFARPLRQSISATTRAARPGEHDGEHYFFLTREEFRRRIDAGDFLEWAQVFGDYYGTPREPVERMRQQGIGQLLVIDVQGAAQVRQTCPDQVSIFLMAPSFEVLEQRLRARHSEDEARIQRRLTAAREELQRAGEYTYRVVNDDLESTVRELRTIITPLFRE